LLFPAGVLAGNVGTIYLDGWLTYLTNPIGDLASVL
jgi:hypothetical protein